MAAAEDRQLVALRVWDPISQFYRSTPPNLPRGSLTSRAHVCFDPALTVTAVLPGPRLTDGRFAPISAQKGSRVRTLEVGTSAAVVGLVGQGPLASSPRSEVSPRPSCPYMLWPQHLTVASSCGEKQPRINDRLRIGLEMWGGSI